MNHIDPIDLMTSAGPVVTIRPASKEDEEAIDILLSTYFLDRDGVALNDFVVAEVQARVVGAACFIHRPCPELHTIAVHPNYRGTGIGSNMVEYIVEHMPAAWKQLYVRTTAPVFFRKLGFVEPADPALRVQLWDDCRHCERIERCAQHVLCLGLEK